MALYSQRDKRNGHVPLTLKTLNSPPALSCKHQHEHIHACIQATHLVLKIDKRAYDMLSVPREMCFLRYVWDVSSKVNQMPTNSWCQAIKREKIYYYHPSLESPPAGPTTTSAPYDKKQQPVTDGLMVTCFFLLITALLNAAHYKNIKTIRRPAPTALSHPADVWLYLLYFMASVG